MGYENTVIYKIVCKDNNIINIYIGSTTDIDRRRREHKSRCLSGYEYKLYNFIRNNGGWDNWELLEVEKFPCNSKLEAYERERQLYKELNADLNGKSPQLTKEEQLEKYKVYNKTCRDKGYLIEYRKKDKHKEYTKEYCKRSFFCNCGTEVKIKSKSKHLNSVKHLTNMKAIKPTYDI